MWNDAVYVGESGIEGKGLIARRDINQGDIIADCRDLHWYQLHVDQLTEHQIIRNWIIMIDDHMCETTDEVIELNYMNHSRTPNTNWMLREKYITAARCISAGEEITIDYRIEKRSNRTSFPSWI